MASRDCANKTGADDTECLPAAFSYAPQYHRRQNGGESQTFSALVIFLGRPSLHDAQGLASTPPICWGDPSSACEVKSRGT